MTATARIEYVSCPVCTSTSFKPVFKAKDHTVSKEEFEILECEDCSLRFTQAAPDATAIAHYYQSEDYISHTETRKGLINRLYHAARKQTLADKRKLIREATGLQKGELLDIGAGTGAFVKIMKDAGWTVTGLEPDQRAREKAMENHQVELLSAMELFQLPENAFDAITLWHVLEHVHDLHAYLSQLKKLVRPGGRIFIAVPNYRSYDASVYQEYWAAYDVPRHLYHFSPMAMKRLLARDELRLHALKGMWFDSFYISLLSEKYKTGHSGFFRGLFTGAVSNLKAWIDRETCSSLIYVIEKQNLV